MTPELLEAIEQVTFSVPSRILASGRPVMPVVIVFGDQMDRIIGVPHMMDSDGRKEALAQFITDTAHSPGVKAVALVCEAWAVQIAEGEPYPERARDHPNRFEAVMVIVHEPTGVAGMFSHQIKRDGETVTLERGPFEPRTEFKELTGRFADPDYANPAKHQ